MRRDAKASTALNAIAQMIEQTFDADDWIRLGAASDNVHAIRDHDRLLRSLSFGDDDYFNSIYDVLPEILGQRPKKIQNQTVTVFDNLPDVEQHLELEAWLRENQPKSHAALYGGAGTDYIEELVGAVDDPLTAADIEHHARRIRSGLNSDPAQAVGSAKDLLETVLKSVLELHGTGKETKLELPKLVSSALDRLGMNPGAIGCSEPAAVQVKRLAGSLSTIVQTAGELRNGGFGTGHGVSRTPQLEPALAKLAVSSALTVATFFIEAAKSRSVGDYGSA